MLTALQHYRCDRLLTLKDLPAGARAYADEILETAKSAADLTRQLLTFARRQPQGDQIIDVNRVVAESVGMLRRLVGSRIELETELAPDVGQVRADPSRLQQVLMNLAANARDAMPSGGRLTIRTSLTDVAPSTMGVAGLPAVQHVTLQVTDTGCGMDEATQAHIFEPLFSTKDLEKGTGLGLATVQSIVKKLGGVRRLFAAGCNRGIHAKLKSELRKPPPGLSTRVSAWRSLVLKRVSHRPRMQRPKKDTEQTSELTSPTSGLRLFRESHAKTMQKLRIGVSVQNEFCARCGNLSHLLWFRAIPPTIGKSFDHVYVLSALGTPPVDHELVICRKPHLPYPRGSTATAAGQR